MKPSFFKGNHKEMSPEMSAKLCMNPTVRLRDTEKNNFKMLRKTTVERAIRIASKV